MEEVAALESRLADVAQQVNKAAAQIVFGCAAMLGVRVWLDYSPDQARAGTHFAWIWCCVWVFAELIFATALRRSNS